MRYETQLIWPPFKGKAHKVVDTSTGKGVGLYRTPEGARRKAAAMNRDAAAEPAAPMMTPAELAAAAGDTPADHFHACARCGQTVITRADPPICPTCRKLERAPQGETVRLFEPAPAQLPGHLAF